MGKKQSTMATTSRLVVVLLLIVAAFESAELPNSLVEDSVGGLQSISTGLGEAGAFKATPDAESKPPLQEANSVHSEGEYQSLAAKLAVLTAKNEKLAAELKQFQSKESGELGEAARDADKEFMDNADKEFDGLRNSTIPRGDFLRSAKAFCRRTPVARRGRTLTHSKKCVASNGKRVWDDPSCWNGRKTKQGPFDSSTKESV